MDDRLHPVQIEAFRRMTPGQKLAVALRLIQETRELKAFGVRQRHPDWTDEQVNREVSDAFLYAID